MTKPRGKLEFAYRTIAALEQKLEAAQARVAELEKQEPLAWVDADWIAQVSDPRGAGCTVRRAYGSAGANLSPVYSAPVAQAGQVPEIPAQWSKSLSHCWPKYLDDKDGDWCVGTVDEDGRLYEVLLVEASQYDAAGESQKIAEAIVSLWSFAAAPQPAGDADHE